MVKCHPIGCAGLCPRWDFQKFELFHVGSYADFVKIMICVRPRPRKEDVEKITVLTAAMALARHVLVCAVSVLASCSGALAASSSVEAQEAYLIHVHRQPSILGAVGRPLVSRKCQTVPSLPAKGDASARA